jgi:hypothetical protein
MTAEDLANDPRFQQASYSLVHFGQRPAVDLKTFGPSEVVNGAIKLLIVRAAELKASEGEQDRRDRAVDDAIYPGDLDTGPETK